MTPHTNTTLSWVAYKAEHPNVRIRQAAATLGVSEVELLSSDLSDHCIRLKPDILAILAALPSLGNVMALTRNEAAVHEVTADFLPLSMKNQTALFFRPGQDTRFFTDKWKYAFAVNENSRQSLQFFDRYGIASHKIYLVDDSHIDNYIHLVTEFEDDVQTPVQQVDNPAIEPETYTHIDTTALRQRWSAIKNVHEGQMILKSLNNHRINAYEALGDNYAIKLPATIIETVLNALSEKKIEAMIFVQNETCVQSFAGPIKRLLRTGPWFNVLDAGFNLHLNTEQLSQVWLIKKPSSTGPVHSLNAFDHEQNEVLTLVDNRSKGQRESAEWVALVDSLKGNHSLDCI